MRIGLLTFHRSGSHGAFLQAYALCRHLTEAGHSVQIIDYMPGYRWRAVAAYRRRWRKRHLGLNMSNVSKIREGYLFRRAVRQHLPLTPRQYQTPEELQTFPPDLDACIVGSDQIWNTDITGGSFDPVFFANFGPDSMKRVSYAASFGRLPALDRNPNLARYLGRLDHISVREQDALQVVSSQTGRNAELVLDPTFLLARDAYPRVHVRPPAERYVFSYILHPDAFTSAITTHVAATLELPLVDASSAIRICGRLVGRADPFQFLSLLRRAEYVVTNSFHGLALAIHHRRNFTCAALTGSMANRNARLTNLLSLTQLESRFATAGNLSRLDISPIDWTTPAQNLARRQCASEAFLTESLQS